jgi:hypothetical protein
MRNTAFEEVIRLSLEQFSPEEAKRQHIAIARSVLAEYLTTSGTSPDVSIETDGHKASSEESVKPFGVIVYRFTYMQEITAYALALARELSPVDSGRFKGSWFAMVDHAEIEPAAIPPGATVIITNDQPYLRKIHQGSKGFERYVPPGIVEKVRQQVLRRYKQNVDAYVEFITLEGGYILKGGRPGARHRKDTAAGRELTYPSLKIQPRAYA